MTYTGIPAQPALDPAPAFLTTKRAGARSLRCLDFGRAPHRLGSVCLDNNGLIAPYKLSTAVTYGAYEQATLRSYTPRIPLGTFTLPAKPAPAP